jgi:PadR family transcriptional regulator, regulatory protein AphA
MSLPHALLGLLAVEPRSGYELTKAFEGYLGQYAWGAGHTSIYPELGKLLDAGLVSVTAEGARGSRTYAVTDAGRANLREWMFNRPKNRKVRNEEVLRMFLISGLDHDDAIGYLRMLAEKLGEQLEDLRALRARSGPVSQPGRAGFGLLAAEYGLRQLEATHGWAEWAIEQLEGADEPAQAGRS